MIDLDYQKISALLTIAEQCTGHSGKLSNLQSAAISELIKINDEIKADASRKTDPINQPVELVPAPIQPPESQPPADDEGDDPTIQRRL